MVKLVVGLGNIGKEYEKTVHNMGFVVIDEVAKKFNVSFKKKECDACTAEIFINGQKIILAKPTTYMNNSGISVKQFMNKYKIEPEQVVVICDDIDLDQGIIRVKPNGSAGTHNGLKSIIHDIGSQDFVRVRVGVGAPPEYVNLVDYVLSKIKIDDNLQKGIEKATNSVYDLIDNQMIEKVMNKYNTK